MVTRVGEGGLAGAEAARHDEKGGAPRGYAATLPLQYAGQVGALTVGNAAPEVAAVARAGRPRPYRMRAG